MKDFDQEFLQHDDALTFRVRGEVFQMVYVRPEVLAEWEDQRATELAEARAQMGDDPDAIVTVNAAQQSIDRFDQRIKSFLRDEDKPRWDELRAREKDAVPYVQLREIVNWMVEVQSSRPTETPSPSGAGRGRTGRSSTARSRSQEATRAA